jgi:hypothetical protein
MSRGSRDRDAAARRLKELDAERRAIVAALRGLGARGVTMPPQSIWIHPAAAVKPAPNRQKR